MYKRKGNICIGGAIMNSQFCSMKKLLSILVSGLLTTTLLAFSGYYDQQTNQNAVNGIAIAGYDAVAYFTLQNAVKGDSAIQLEWNGATWYFLSKDNRKLFEAIRKSMLLNMVDIAPIEQVRVIRPKRIQLPGRL